MRLSAALKLACPSVFEHDNLSAGRNLNNLDNVALGTFLGKSRGFVGHTLDVSIGAGNAVVPYFKHATG